MNKFKLHFLILLLFASQISFSQNQYSSKTIKRINSIREKLKTAKAENDSHDIAHSYYKLAIKYDYLGESDSCYLYYNKALSIAKKINNSKAIAVISNSLATTYSDRGFHSKAIKIYSSTIKRFLSVSDTASAAGVMLNYSAEYMDIGKYEKALKIALKSLKLKLSISDSTNIAAYYEQIGILFNSIGNKQKWEKYILIANSLVKKNKKYGDFYRRMDILTELGSYYFSKNDFKRAENYYDTLLVQSKQNDYSAGISTGLTNLVSILKNQKKYSKAIEYLVQSLKLSEKSNNIYKIISNLIQTAKLDIILNKKYVAEKNILRAKALSEKYNYPNKLISAYKILSGIYEKRFDYKKAFIYSNKYHALKDSIESGQTKSKIAELETKYQTEKKDNQINLLNKKNILNQKKIEGQKQFVIIIIVSSLLLFSLLLLIYLQNKLKSQTRILDLDQKLLRTQMNPHFIFNALIAIQNYVLKNKKFEASDYLSEFASLMRFILKSSRKNFCLLKNEIELLKYYVSLQQLRFNNSFKFELYVDENIETAKFQLPPMIIQPFVENAIEHGLRNRENDEKILSVKYILTDDYLQIFVEDNGIGIDKTNSDKSGEKHRSFAMEITRERLTNITKLYKEKINIEIHDLSKFENKHGTQVKLTFPLKLIARNYND